MLKCRLITVLCLMGVLYFNGCKQRDNAEPNMITASEVSVGEPALSQIIVYYFHPKFRCPTCQMIEMLAEKTVEAKYPNEIAADRVVWLGINIDEPENREFIETFNLQTSTLVIAEMRLDKIVRWKKLENVWNLINNQDEFAKYIVAEIEQYLE